MGDSWATEVLETLITHMEQARDDVSIHAIPATPASYSPWPRWVAPELRDYFADQGIQQLYSHQAAAATAAWERRDVVIATGTSSGKSLCYLLPVLTTLHAQRAATALYITPTKALGADQLQATQRICQHLSVAIHPASYDGDTESGARKLIREESRFIFSNPDMLHLSILGQHTRWMRLLRNLEFIIIDEAHSYRGVFGAHVALVLRRLLRLAQHYGAHPTVIFASATSADPAAQAAQLIGRRVQAITADGSPHGARSIVLWSPPWLPDSQPPQRRSASAEAGILMAQLIDQGLRTLTFVRSRREAEIVALDSARQVADPTNGTRIKAYRAGYLAEERRELERQLDNGVLLGLASTNALELGIDVGGLDGVIITGFPGSIASFWQQAGRAGRRGQSSVVLFIARNNPLDAYLCAHPDALLAAPIERNVFNPFNPNVLDAHLLCAACEAPLTAADIELFQATEAVTRLAAHHLLRHRNQAWFAAPNADPYSQVFLRGSGGIITIVDEGTGRILGTVDEASARTQVHPGAIYLHQGQDYQVSELNFDQQIALAHPSEQDYRTEVRTTSDIRILETPTEVQQLLPGVWLSNVWVEVRDEVTSYQVRSFQGANLGEHPLDLPPSLLQTRAVAYTLDPLVVSELGLDAAALPGALHAAEHAAIGMLPLLATCDRLDIGGVSTALHADTGLPTVFVYDGHPGGAGFADCGYQHFVQWMQMTYETVRDCPCATGCPSCIQSPKCGNGNEPLDKAGALAILQLLSEVPPAPVPGLDSPKFLR